MVFKKRIKFIQNSLPALGLVVAPILPTILRSFALRTTGWPQEWAIPYVILACVLLGVFCIWKLPIRFYPEERILLTIFYAFPCLAFGFISTLAANIDD